jgi:putative FmdB family regulatory protein
VPIYGYRCSNCGHEFEIQQRMSNEPLKVCPKCGGKLNKMVYPAGVIFKGSGFYSTDYKGSGQLTSSNGSSADGDAKSDVKTEPKPESKPESNSKSED